MQPNNPIVGGITLRIPAIRSPDYVAGISGWTINIDGTAEFNNVTVRGRIVEGTGPQIIIDTDGTIKFYDVASNLVMVLTGGTPFIAITSVAHTDLFLDARKSGDTFPRFQIAANGTLFWGSGAASWDTALTPGGGGSLDISGSAANTGDLTINSRSTGRGIPQAPTTTASNGSATSAGTEVRDSILGNYVFTAIAGRRYRIQYNPHINTSATAGSIAAIDHYVVNIRDGGNATPTTASTLVATGTVAVPVGGGPGQVSLTVTDTYAPGAGTVTLGAFTQRINGTGTGTPVQSRSLYVEDIGTSA